MTPLDVILAVAWLGVVLGGFWKGAIRIVFGVGGAVAGAWLALVAHGEVSSHLVLWLPWPWFAEVLGWLLPPVACLALAFTAGWGMERTLEALHLGWLNRLAGAALAGVVGAVLLGLLLLAAVAGSPAVRRMCDRSLVAPLVSWFASPNEADHREAGADSPAPPDSGEDASSGR